MPDGTAPSEGDIARAVLGRLIANPETRAPLLTLLRKQHPDMPIPELDAVAPINKRIEDLEKKNEALLKRLEDGDQDRSIAGRFGKLQAARGFTDEGIDAIKKLMVDKNIADPDAAADHYDAEERRKNPPQIEPGATWGGSAYLDTKAEAVEGWFKDPDRMVDQEIAAVLQESAAGRR